MTRKSRVLTNYLIICFVTLINGCNNNTVIMDKCSNPNHVSTIIYDLFTQDSGRTIEYALWNDLKLMSEVKQISASGYINLNGDSLFITHSDSIITISTAGIINGFKIPNNGLISGVRITFFNEKQVYGEFMGCNGSKTSFMIYPSNVNHLVIFD